MKNTPLLLLLSLLCLASMAAAQTPEDETKLLRFPDLSQTQIVFSYSDDLWIVDRAGGEARRLTSHSGTELYARFSPDGKWIAFSAAYDGNYDVYVISVQGGEPRRMTFHPNNDWMVNWAPDGNEILFRSSRYAAPPRFYEYFTVKMNGEGMPEKLPIPYGGWGSYSPDGKSIAYNVRGRESRPWKRYRGGRTDFVGIFNLEDNSYFEMDRPNANDFWPMWDAKGIYFASDRDRHLNLWHYDLSTQATRQLTSFSEYDVKWPALGPGAIVFENGGTLHLFDLESEQVEALKILVRSELLVARGGMTSVKGAVRSGGISPSGKRAVFEARGEIFTVPAENGPTRRLTHSSGAFDRNPAWSPDGKTIAYISDRDGEWAIYLQDQMGGEAQKLVDTKDLTYLHELLWSPDSKKLLYWDQVPRIWCVDVESKKRTLMATSDVRYGVGSPAWSPDSRWVAYEESESYGNSNIMLWSYDEKESTQLTSSFFLDFNPTFDHDGKYLYFASSRHFYPSGGQFDWHFEYYEADGIFAVMLDSETPSPFAPESDEEGDEDEDAEDKDADKEDDKKENGEEEDDEKEVEPIVVVLDGIQQRVVQLPLPAGNYGGMLAGDNKLFYARVPFEMTQMARPDAPEGAELHVFDMEEKESELVTADINWYELSADGEKLLIASDGSYSIVDAKADAETSDGKLDLSGLEVEIDYRAEWTQLFREGWRIERDFFWDPDMGGMDWKGIGERYEKLLPWVSHRSDLNYLLTEMVSELVTSHSYVGGGDYPDRKRVNVGLLGVDFEAGDGYWKLAKIYAGEDWDENRISPLTQPGLGVSAGDYLIAVDGVETPVTDNPYSHFQGKAGQLVELLVNSEPRREGATTVLIETVRSERGVRFLDWVEKNRRIVDEATDGRVGYIYVPDTYVDGLREFDKYLQGQITKEALIVDERFNAGGMIPDFYTDKLKKKLLNFITPRNGKDTPWPPSTVYGPKVMLANEFAGSGGDAFPWYFQREGIGPVIGTRTWGGLVGISRSVPMIDGGRVTAPEVAFWAFTEGEDGDWIVENYGVAPDIEVENRADAMAAGRDPQLEAGIEYIMGELAKVKPWPKRPEFPRGK